MKPQQLPTEKINYQVVRSDYNEQGYTITNEPEEFYDVNFPLSFVSFKRTLTDEIRNNIIPGIIGNYLLLNPTITADRIRNSINAQIKRLYFNNISEFWLENEILKAIELYELGLIEPYNIRFKTFWIDPNATNRKEIYSTARKSITLSKLDEFFDEVLPGLNCVVTDEFIAEYMDMNLKTVKRNLSPTQKEIKKQFNLIIREGLNETKKKIKADKRKLKQSKDMKATEDYFQQEEELPIDLTQLEEDYYNFNHVEYQYNKYINWLGTYGYIPSNWKLAFIFANN